MRHRTTGRWASAALALLHALVLCVAAPCACGPSSDAARDAATATATACCCGPGAASPCAPADGEESQRHACGDPLATVSAGCAMAGSPSALAVDLDSSDATSGAATLVVVARLTASSSRAPRDLPARAAPLSLRLTRTTVLLS